MPFIDYANKKVYYDYQQNSGPVVLFINGLTHNSSHWIEYRTHISTSGASTLCFDVPGQAQSEIPDQRLEFSDISDVIVAILDHLKISKVYVIGISFGAAIAIRFALLNKERVIGMITMGGHSEKDTLYKCLHQALIDAANKGGMGYLFDFLTGLNYSHDWIKKNERKLAAARKMSELNNNVTAIRYFLETILTSPDVTGDLGTLDFPVLIMCGEKDILSPRWCQEILRSNIRNSNMFVIQNACHAFTIESPRLSKQICAWFIQQVENGKWVGNQRTWIASEQDEENFNLIPCNRKS
jgi:3-oxoadipate enol-lactonase